MQQDDSCIIKSTFAALTIDSLCTFWEPTQTNKLLYQFYIFLYIGNVKRFCIICNLCTNLFETDTIFMHSCLLCSPVFSCGRDVDVTSFKVPTQMSNVHHVFYHLQNVLVYRIHVVWTMQFRHIWCINLPFGLDTFTCIDTVLLPNGVFTQYRILDIFI